jgi:hypothetical protein
MRDVICDLQSVMCAMSGMQCAGVRPWDAVPWCKTYPCQKDYVCLKCTSHYCEICCIQFYSNLFYSELFNVSIKDTTITSFGKKSNLADIVYTWAETAIKVFIMDF